MKIIYNEPVTSFGKKGYINQFCILVDQHHENIIIKTICQDGSINALIEVPKDNIADFISALSLNKK